MLLGLILKQERVMLFITTCRSFTAQTKMGVRPASAADAVGYKMRVASEKHYVSSYQAQRTEAWKNSKLTRPTSSGEPHEPS